MTNGDEEKLAWLEILRRMRAIIEHTRNPKKAIDAYGGVQHADDYGSEGYRYRHGSVRPGCTG